MSGPILRDIVKLGWPVLIAQVAVMVNGVFDHLTIVRTMGPARLRTDG